MPLSSSGSRHCSGMCTAILLYFQSSAPTRESMTACASVACRGVKRCVAYEREEAAQGRRPLPAARQSRAGARQY